MKWASWRLTRLLLAGVLAAAASAGCAHFRKVGPEPVPAEPAPAAPKAHLVVDTNQVVELQNRVLQELRSEDEADLHPCNHFTHWLDSYHDRMYRRMDNAVRRVDTLWLTENVRPYDYELSTFKLKSLLKVGGRSNDDDTEFKVKFRADMALPGLKRRLHLFLDNAGRDYLPGQDPMDQEGDTRLGARAVRQLRNSAIDLGGGLRFHSGKPVSFADIEWHWHWGDETNGLIELSPRGYWYSNEDGFGQSTVLAWSRAMGPRSMFQLRLAERSTEKTGGVEFEQSLRYGRFRSSRTRGYVVQLSAFPHYKDADLLWDDYLLNITWRWAVYRKWIYCTVTPQVQFPKEDDYHARPSLRIGLEMLMGGKISDLF